MFESRLSWPLGRMELLRLSAPILVSEVYQVSWYQIQGALVPNRQVQDWVKLESGSMAPLWTSNSTQVLILPQRDKLVAKFETWCAAAPYKVNVSSILTRVK